MTATIPNSVRQQTSATGALTARIIEGDPVAAYLYGSVVEGGLKPQGDIDLLVTIKQLPSTRQRKDLIQGFLETSVPPGSADSHQVSEVITATSS